MLRLHLSWPVLQKLSNGSRPRCYFRSFLHNSAQKKKACCDIQKQNSVAGTVHYQLVKTTCYFVVFLADPGDQIVSGQTQKHKITALTPDQAHTALQVILKDQARRIEHRQQHQRADEACPENEKVGSEASPDGEEEHIAESRKSSRGSTVKTCDKNKNKKTQVSDFLQCADFLSAP